MSLQKVISEINSIKQNDGEPYVMVPKKVQSEAIALISKILNQYNGKEINDLLALIGGMDVIYVEALLEGARQSELSDITPKDEKAEESDPEPEETIPEDMDYEKESVNTLEYKVYTLERRIDELDKDMARIAEMVSLNNIARSNYSERKHEQPAVVKPTGFNLKQLVAELERIKVDYQHGDNLWGDLAIAINNCNDTDAQELFKEKLANFRSTLASSEALDEMIYLAKAAVAPKSS